MAEIGRPSAYKEEYNEQAYKLCLLGATDKELGNFFEVDERTINNWKKEFPDFFQSIKRGKDEADANVAQSLYNRACGCKHPEQKVLADGSVVEITKYYPPETAACFIWLKNRQSSKWRDKFEVDTNKPTIGDNLASVLKQITG